MTVILGGGGAYPRMIYHALVAAGVDVGRVVVEDPVPRGPLLRRRAKKLGWGTVFGQVAFGALVAAPLSRRSRRRVTEIRSQFNLNDSPVPPDRLMRVPSVNAPETLAALRSLRPAVVVVSGTRIISRDVLENVPARFVNLHAGITPAYRGVHGGYWALADGRPEACGVTIHLVDPGIDTGAVLAQAPIHPDPRDNFTTYPYLQLAAGLPLLVEVVRKLEAGEAARPVAPPAGPSRLHSHPTLAQYLYYRLKRGVR